LDSAPPRLPLDCPGTDGVGPGAVRDAQQEWAKYLGRKVEEEVEIADGVKMTFVLVPPGKFLMGYPKDEDYLELLGVDETQHAVRLTEPFYLGKTEVTQTQYMALGLPNPSEFPGPDLPVERVSWLEARDWAVQYVYFYNPYTHLYWGRCPLQRDGKAQYSLLAEKDCKGSLSEIPESAFPAPGDPPAVPESSHGLKMELPPEDLPKDLPREGAPKGK
jgi:hypothetical protein